MRENFFIYYRLQKYETWNHAMDHYYCSALLLLCVVVHKCMYVHTHVAKGITRT